MKSIIISDFWYNLIMINSIVSIYKTRIIPEKRMIVENLDSYLESCPKATIADFI